MMDKLIKNPWPGLSSYEDPFVGGNRYIFCGRNSEVYDLVRLIDDSFFVTLYGKSGIGKSSILKAGVFPCLRKDMYLPIMLRLGLVNESEQFQPILCRAIEMAIRENGGTIETINVVQEEENTLATEYLWNFFARHRFYDRIGNVVFPVIVLDQFEEVFRKRHLGKKAKLLLSQINYLIDENHAIGDCKVNGKEYFYDFNFRFVVSIREDELFRLEETLDNNFLPALKNCRYRLKSLTEQGARDVVSIPGDGMFNNDEESSVVDSIINAAKNETADGYSTNVLSLICSRIYEEAVKLENWPISLAKVKEFLEGNPFERFYYEATEGLPAKEKHYIEDNLIDSTGRRNAITEEDFIKNVPHGNDLLIEGPRKILQRVSVSSDAERPRIELIHDSFCAPLARLKQQRNNTKELRITAITLFSAFVVVVVAFWINTRVRKVNDLLSIQSRYVAEEALRLAEQDHKTAAKLVLEILPKELNRPNRPYTPEGEYAARKIWEFYNHGYRLKIKDPLVSLAISEDNGFIAGASEDNTVFFFERKKGTGLSLVDSMKIKSSCPVAIANSGGKLLLAYGGENGAVFIWDIGRQSLVNQFPGDTNAVTYLQFDELGASLTAVKSNNTICVFNLDKMDTINEVRFPTDYPVLKALFNNSGDRLLVIDKLNSTWIIDCRTLEIISHSGVSLPYPNDAYLGEDKLLHVSISNGEFFSYRMEDKAIVPVVYDGTSKIGIEKQFYQTRINDIIHKEGESPEICCYDISNNYELFLFAIGSSAGTYKKSKVGIWEQNKGVRYLTVEISELSRIEQIIHRPGTRSALLSADVVSLIDIDTGAILDTLRDCSTYCKKVFSPDGNTLYLEGYDSIEVWDLMTREKIKTISREHYSFDNMVLSPDGKCLAALLMPSRELRRDWDEVSDVGDSICVWNTHTYEELWFRNAHDGGIYSLNYSEDGSKLISCSSDESIKIWDVMSGRLLGSVSYSPEYYCVLSFSPDGKKSITCYNDDNVSIRDIKEDDSIFMQGKHLGYVTTLDFDCKGNYLISGSTDSVLRIWNANTGALIVDSDDRDNNSAAIHTVAFSPDGRHIASCSDDGILLFRDFPSLQEVINDLKNRVMPYSLRYDELLSPSEKKEYYLE